MIGLELSSHSRSASDCHFQRIISLCQDSSSFYLVMSARNDSASGARQGNWQVKRVSSWTGPNNGTIMTVAIRKPESVAGHTKLLWRADTQDARGWIPGHSYRFSLLHRPRLGLIRLQLWEGERRIADSGNIIDDGQESLRGGRLGVYCDSQEKITWSALSYR